MAVSADLLSRLLDCVYRAGVEPQHWPEAVNAIGSAFAASTLTGLVVHGRSSGSFPLVAIDSSAPPEPMLEYGAYYAGIDDMRAFARTQPVGALLTEVVALEDERMRRGECYNDFYVRWNMQHWVGSYVVNDGQREGSLVVYRGTDGGPFSSDEHRLMDLLVPHVRRALDLGMRLGAAAATEHGFAGALDELAAGVVVLDRAGRVLWANRSAREVFASRNGLSAAHGELSAASPTWTARLRCLVASALVPASAAGSPTHLLLPRLSGGHYSVVAAPLRPGVPLDLPATPAAMLVVTDAAASPGSLAELVREAYGLTPAEAELAMALVGGKSLQEAAEERRTTQETARGQLKSVLHKTGARRQAELVALLLRSAAATVRGAGSPAATDRP